MTEKPKFEIIEPVSESGWKCYLFGTPPNGTGLVYMPRKGHIPNFFVRWMMKVCLGCTWMKEKP